MPWPARNGKADGLSPAAGRLQPITVRLVAVDQAAEAVLPTYWRDSATGR
jgi:hypothetical protein